jgi:hypothetical protein
MSPGSSGLPVIGMALMLHFYRIQQFCHLLLLPLLPASAKSGGEIEFRLRAVWPGW